MRAFWDEVRANLRSPVVMAAWGFLTVMMALTGPYGSYEHVPVARRLAFWLCLTALAIVVATVVRVLVFSRLGLSDYRRGATLTSLLVAAVVAVPLHLVLGVVGAGYGIMAPGMIELGVFIFCLTMGFCAFRHALEAQAVAGLRPDPAGAAVEQGEDAPVLPRLVGRLPPQMQGPVRRVSGRDHYVEVQTDRGTTNLLLRFSDALAELDAAEGLQVHRSHWVAHAAIAGTEREGARVFLRLTCGTVVPVSRTHLPAVESLREMVQA